MNHSDFETLQGLHRKLNSSIPKDPDLRVKALESLLVEKGLLNSETVDEWIEIFTEKVGPRNGAQVVAKAWLDVEFHRTLLDDPTTVMKDMGFLGIEGSRIIVVENTPKIHNVIVCTLCSCYPWSILGLPPTWYKSAAYRSRIVREPRLVLSEFGLSLDDDVEVRVWDSTSELRYMVLPEPPENIAGMSAEQLTKLITRNSMIGTEKILPENHIIERK